MTAAAPPTPRLRTIRCATCGRRRFRVQATERGELVLTCYSCQEALEIEWTRATLAGSGR